MKLRVIDGGLAHLPRVVKRIHSQEWWEKELKRLCDRLERIKAMNAGRADVTLIQVKETKVRAHVRAAHERIVITMKKQPRRATK